MMKTYRTNVVGPLLVTQALIPELEKKTTKQVFNLSSVLGSVSIALQNGIVGNNSYSSSKAALNMITVKFALQFKDQGYTFVAVHPGWLRTDMGGQSAPLDVSQGVAGIYKVPSFSLE